MLTKERLSEIKGRADKATKGPWIGSFDIVCQKGFGAETIACGLFSDDRDFIAHAREDIPAMHAEIERVWAILEQRAEPPTNERRQAARAASIRLRQADLNDREKAALEALLIEIERGWEAMAKLQHAEATAEQDARLSNEMRAEISAIRAAGGPDLEPLHDDAHGQNCVGCRIGFALMEHERAGAEMAAEIEQLRIKLREEEGYHAITQGKLVTTEARLAETLEEARQSRNTIGELRHAITQLCAFERVEPAEGSIWSSVRTEDVARLRGLLGDATHPTTAPDHGNAMLAQLQKEATAAHDKPLCVVCKGAARPGGGPCGGCGQ